MELSLNTHEKSEDQRKRINENMFNSQITVNNSPVNAIRRVVKKKKKPIKRPPGIDGVIEEDVEGEEDYSEEDVEVEEEGREEIMPSGQLELERVDVQQSSDEDSDDAGKAKKIDMKFGKKEEAMEEKESKKKKDKKKSKENPGYNKEELERGKQLMSNASFKSNLDRLRSKFKDAGKGGINDSPQPQQKPTLVPPKSDSKPEPEKVKHQDNVHEYGAHSEVILGDKGPKLDDTTKQQVVGNQTRGLKDLSKGKPLMPSVKFDTVKKSAEVPDNETEKVDIKPAIDKKAQSKPKEEKISEQSTSVATDKSTKPKVVEKQSTSESYTEDWKLKIDNFTAAKPKTTAPILSTLKTAQQPKPEEPVPSLKKKPKHNRDDSDNSWDEGKNPFS